MKIRKVLLLIFSCQLCHSSPAEPESFEIEVDVSHLDYGAIRFNESRKENHRNRALDHYLSEKKIDLPKNDYLVVAYQPVGIVSSCIIINLEHRTARILPGTHQEGNERKVGLSQSEFDYLSELVSSEIIKNFPSQSGKFGGDGYSLVVYTKSRETERYLSHWTPEYIGLDIFKSIHEHFKNKSNNNDMGKNK